MFPDPKIDYKPVSQSSNVAVLGWEQTDMLTGRLHVGFKSGAVWSYGPLTADEYAAIKVSQSAGQAVSALVKRTRLAGTDPQRLEAKEVAVLTPGTMEAKRLELFETRKG